jgi:type II secretory pathway pseudopilin PulG
MRGIGLVELMVVVAIISMIMAAALPSYQRVQRKARAAAIANDFRVFSAVFQTYAHEKGTWPAEVPAGVLPVEFTANEINIQQWTRPTPPIGGKFDWESNQVHPGGTSPGGRWRAALAISDTPDSPLLMDLELYQEIDAALDDGDLSTGSFRLGENNCPLLILEP